jgi:hypothetical protein
MDPHLRDPREIFNQRWESLTGVGDAEEVGITRAQVRPWVLIEARGVRGMRAAVVGCYLSAVSDSDVSTRAFKVTLRYGFRSLVS